MRTPQSLKDERISHLERSLKKAFAKRLYIFVLKEFGIELSPMLEHLILNPLKLQGVNNADLERIVKEYASIYQKRRIVLDGEKEWSQIATFELFLFCRLTNKSELRKIFELS